MTQRWPLEQPTRHRPRAVLVDCGNTILRPDPRVIARVLTSQSAAQWAEPLADTLGLVADLHTIDLPLVTTVEPFYLWWRRLSGIPEDLSDVVLRELTEQPDLYTLLDPSVRPAFHTIRRAGIRVAVVANAEGQTASEMQQYGLADYVDVVIDSAAVGARKPNREIYDEASNRLGLPLDACWFVGDALFNDVLGPLRAGVAHAVLYDPDRRFLRAPVDRVDSMTALAALATTAE